jgi:hypothetical protein
MYLWICLCKKPNKLKQITKLLRISTLNPLLSVHEF